MRGLRRPGATTPIDERGAIEIVMLVGRYRMLATALRTLRVVPDRPRR